MKVLYIDHWTRGIKNFLYFDGDLKKHKCQTKLVHFSSFKNIPFKKVEIIDGLECVDISYYRTKFISKVIEIEQPDLIVILNLGNLLDRSIILAAKKYNVPVVYLAHGCLADPDILDEKTFNVYFSNKYYERLKRFLFIIVPNYFASLLKYDAKKLFSVYPYKILVQSLLKPAKTAFFPSYVNAFDLAVNQAIVYSKNDFDLLCKLGFPAHKVETVGNPDFDDFLKRFTAGEKFSPLVGQKFVLYIDESFVTNRLCSFEEDIAFLHELSTVVTSKNFHFVVKLHPRSYPFVEQYKTALPNCTFFTTADFYNLFGEAEYVISTASSVLYFAMLLKKPILSPRWSIGRKIPKYFDDGIVTYCESSAEMERLIDSAHTNSHEFRDAFVQRNVTHFDGQAVKRISNLIVRAVSNTKNKN